MKKSIVIILLFISKISNGQDFFVCSKLTISDVIIKKEMKDLEIIEEDTFDRGPWLDFYCEFTNYTEDTIILSHHYSKVVICFFYKNKEYSIEPAIFGDIGNQTIHLLPFQSTSFRFSENIFYNITEIYSSSRIDYTKDLLQILPTLYVTYYNKGLRKRMKIENVELNF